MYETNFKMAANIEKQRRSKSYQRVSLQTFSFYFKKVLIYKMLFMYMPSNTNI